MRAMGADDRELIGRPAAGLELELDVQ